MLFTRVRSLMGAGSSSASPPLHSSPGTRPKSDGDQQQRISLSRTSKGSTGFETRSKSSGSQSRSGSYRLASSSPAVAERESLNPLFAPSSTSPPPPPLPPLPQTTASRSTPPFTSATHQISGTRHAMEDFAQSCAIDARTALYAVFDGHGDASCARFFAESLASLVRDEFAAASDGDWADSLSRALARCGRQWDELPHVCRQAGTVAGAMRVSGTRYVVAHVGDVGVVASTSKGGCVAVTHPHRSDDDRERRRIEREGGRVIDGRLLGVLAPSRAFGNLDLRSRPGGRALSSECDVTEGTLELDAAGTGWILLASDGCFDAMTIDDVARVIRAALAKQWSASAAARAVATHAARRNHDDVTCTVLVFGAPPRDPSSNV